eukprot:TRINITY_DN6742_c1_g1_i10.p1 TRINITY_DN6742_c1_g1~~TRINITY_DN6742_c1_g1_i10.p1  ORF type:complete len:289 (-),score=30.38 TRINITY_DN6742_c1_g1_i10:161-1027(-)
MGTEIERSVAVANLEMQASELEMLIAMYPGDKELHLSNPALLQDIQEFLDGSVLRIPSVEFTINLQMDNGSIVETMIKLPSDYPLTSLPEVYIRSESLKRPDQSRLNKDLQTALKDDSLPQEPCVLFIVDWLQSNATQYLTSTSKDSTTSETDSNSVINSGMFSRLWIYSHHIYSKIKRKNMLDLSKEYCLSGFVLPGKPGIICIEGDSKNTGDWWAIVRNWQWKRLSLKIQQDEKTGDIDGQRKFDGFQEIGEVKGNTRDYHMDMGAFQVYLNNHGFGDLFGELFSI